MSAPLRIENENGPSLREGSSSLSSSASAPSFSSLATLHSPLTTSSSSSLATHHSPFATSYDFLRILLGLLLLIAAGLKAHQLSTEPTLETGLFTSRWFLITVVELELLFGAWLLVGLYPRQTRYAALIFFAALAGISLSKALSGDANCGCFGAVEVNPWFTFSLNAAAILALSFAVPRIVPMTPLHRWGHLALFAGAVVLGATIALPLLHNPVATLADDGTIIGDAKTVVLTPERWVGKRFPLLNHVDIGTDLASGKWIVLLFRPGCARCHAALEQLHQWSDKLSDRSFAVLMVEPGERVHLEHDSLFQGSLATHKTWAIRTPLQVNLQDAVVTSVVAAP